MEYIIKNFQTLDIDWESVPKAELSNSEWTGIAASELSPAYAKVVYIDKGADAGLTVRLYCHENNPRTNITENDGEVFTDSCLEFFCDFLPGSGVGYVNFEMNSNGVLHCAVGPDRHERKFVRSLVKEELIPKPIPIKTDDLWCVQFTVSKDFVRAIYGSDSHLSHGDRIKGNFYKSGECCEPMHFLTWTSVGTETPDYHRPEYFGTLVIE